MMHTLIKKIPIPIVGLILALAAAGNLIQTYGSVYRIALGCIAAILLIFVLAKLILFPSLVKEGLKNPVVASVFPTLTMAIMLLATYLKPMLPSLSFGIWILAMIGHGFLILRFTMKHVAKFAIQKVFPSWFIVYVGIVVGSVTAPAFSMQLLGQALFWFGLVAYFILLPIVIKRVKQKDIADPAKPTIAIFAAPASLCLAGYVSSFDPKHMLMIWILLVISQVSYLFVLSRLVKLLQLPFYPSYSAFTFPLVISAISLKLTNGFLIQSGRSIPWLAYLVVAEEIIAFAIVIYVLIRYILYLKDTVSNEDR